MTNEEGSRLTRGYFRQFRSGYDFAPNDTLAQQMANYSYAIGDSVTKEAVLVDPAYAPENLLSLLEEDDMQLVGVLATHHHPDHIGGRIGHFDVPGIAALLELVDVPIHVQRAELAFVEETTGVVGNALVLHDSGDAIEIGGLSVRLIHTPGHTPGSQCFLLEDLLLTGDTLFIEGCGRMDLPNGNSEQMYESLQHRLAPIPAETEIFPGHAYSPLRSASMGTLRQQNPVLFAHEKNDWLLRYGA